MYCVNTPVKERLRARVDECKEVFDRFNISASRDDMQALVAAWTRMLIAMDAAGPWVGGGNPVGGRLHGAGAPNPAPLPVAVGL